MLTWSNGYDASLSRWKPGSDSRSGRISIFTSSKKENRTSSVILTRKNSMIFPCETRTPGKTPRSEAGVGEFLSFLGNYKLVKFINPLGIYFYGK